MEGGQGDASYVNNSQAQLRTFQKMVHVLKETLDRLQLAGQHGRPKKRLTAADLGCSCGQNTLLIADLHHPPPEFCQ
ncbi:unnamed protein product [Urochloa humidicola]